MSQRSKIPRVAVLGSGKVKEGSPLYKQALRLGQALAKNGFSVYHGGYRGVMEAVAKGCRLSGGHNTGVTIGQNGDSHFLPKSDCPRFYDAELKMPCWQSRLFKLVEMGDAYVFLDGATGTLTELFVVLEMTNRELLKKPILILGKKLAALLRRLKKEDPHFDLPPTLHFTGSISKTIKILLGDRG